MVNLGVSVRVMVYVGWRRYALSESSDMIAVICILILFSSAFCKCFTQLNANIWLYIQNGVKLTRVHEMN